MTPTLLSSERVVSVGTAPTLYQYRALSNLMLIWAGLVSGLLGAYFLNELAITWCARVGNYDVIEGLTLLAMSLQSNFCRHNLMF